MFFKDPPIRPHGTPKAFDRRVFLNGLLAFFVFNRLPPSHAAYNMPLRTVETAGVRLRRTRSQSIRTPSDDRTCFPLRFGLPTPRS